MNPRSNAVQTINGLVNDAETCLSHGKLDRSLVLFSQAAVKIIQHIRSESEFEQVTGRKAGVKHIKLVIPNNAHLFNLARLCLTEIESIANDDIDLEDIETDDDTDDDSVDYDSALNHLAKPMHSAPATLSGLDLADSLDVRAGRSYMCRYGC